MAVPNTAAEDRFAFGLSFDDFKHFAEIHDGNWELVEGVPVKMQSPSIERQWISLEIAAARNKDFRCISGGSFQEPLESERFPGLKVDLSGYETYLGPAESAGQEV